jgi:hypothetical protein
MSEGYGSEQFIDVVYRDVFQAAVTDCESVMLNPPGRQPASRLLALQRWYTSLTETDRAHVHEALREVADAATFGMLCLLDNVRPVADGYSYTLKLTAEGEGTSILLGDNGGLHDLFRARVDDGTDSH